MEEDNFDKIAAEQAQQDVLLDKGLVFKAGKKNFYIKQPYLGTLDYLSAEYIKFDVNREKLSNEDSMVIFEEQKRMISPNAKICSRIVAIAVLNNPWKINFLTWIYAFIFRWTLTPKDLMKLTSIILRASNLQDFTSSIALLSVNRTTAPPAIED